MRISRDEARGAFVGYGLPGKEEPRKEETAEAQRETDTAQKETKEEKEQDLYCSYGMKLLVSID